MAQDVAQVGLGQQIQIVRVQPHPFGAHLDLMHAFLAADVEHRAGSRRQPDRDLQDQRALADARLSAEQDDAAGHDPTAEHTIEFLAGRAQTLDLLGAHVGQALWGHRRQSDALRGHAFSRLRTGDLHDLFDHRIEFAAVRAAPKVARRLFPALAANVAGARLAHQAVLVLERTFSCIIAQLLAWLGLNSPDCSGREKRCRMSQGCASGSAAAARCSRSGLRR